MTAELAAYAPEDIETAIVAHLRALGEADIERKPGALPFRMVTHITGTESPDQGFADAVVSVHTFCDKTLGNSVARDECAKTHRRMLLLRTKPQINLGSRLVAVQYLEVVPGQQPRWEYYSDNILRKVGRYRIGLPYVSS